MKTSFSFLAVAIAIAISAAGTLAIGCSPSTESSASQASHLDESDDAVVEGSKGDHLVGDPIHGFLYGTYASSEGQIAELTLRATNPVSFVRVDRVDPSCSGKDCETREVRGVWDLAHYEGSLTKVIRFYGGDFENLDQFAYERDKDSLTLTYDGRGTLLQWQEPLRAGAGGICRVGDKSWGCAEGLVCSEDLCSEP